MRCRTTIVKLAGSEDFVATGGITGVLAGALWGFRGSYACLSLWV